jgi:hypothetical protein
MRIMDGPSRGLAWISLVALSLGACTGDGTGPSGAVPEPIRAFVAAEGLPQAQDIYINLRDPQAGIVLFGLSFGPPQDCLAGCFYASAAGIMVGQRVGWWGGAVTHRPGFQPFDILPTDQGLFDLTFLKRLRASNDWLYDMFVHFLACDSDTPESLRTKLRDESPIRPFPICPIDF